ncbi:MAG: hypothetical protein Q8K92_06305 [Leadbetterella sp.]|nr:hypothetical protein [Leadbetterella sp.]
MKITVISFLFLSFFLVAFTPNSKMHRNVYLSGIVMDSESLLPISNAEIYDENNILLGSSDSHGFFSTIIKVANQGEILFKLKIKKNGYDSYIQKEHWGDLSGNSYATYYFGLKSNNQGYSKSFAKLSMNDHINDFEDVINDLDAILLKIKLEKKIENAKLGNNTLFFNVENKHYLISNTGWIEIKSPNESISINGETTVVANKLNDIVKRSEVKRMSTIKHDIFSTVIYTK